MLTHLPPSPPTTTGSINLAAGSITLVGAGPGDPELLTIKAVRAIAAATVILVDDLVGDGVLAYANPTARIIPVGKRGGGMSTPQSFIEKLMLQAAQEGEVVVRLKGGDPFMFGRGGEEVHSLQEAGFTVQVVNGITSGLAAATSLGVALTHRHHATGVLFITGHAKPGGASPDWAALAVTAHQERLTLVIYMGVKQAPHIQNGLLQGLPASTPVAVVAYASLPHERRAVCQLDGLHQVLIEQKLGSPSIILVGDVLRGMAALRANAESLAA